MDFRIADTFTDSLSRLTGDEQKAAKTTAFDLQVNPAQPSLSFHKLDRAKDKHFWSVRVSSDIRIIVHKTEASLLLCYVDHHDKAYHWAERRKLETHPTTGAAQLVEIRERVQEITVPKYIEVAKPALSKPPLFVDISDAALLAYGVPKDWIPDARKATEDTVLALADHLPVEAAEALLELATGGKPKTAPIAPAGASPFEHPDAQRRFRVMRNVEELERALAYPWEKWTIFLHPDQRDWVERDFNGPARVSGSAGTGKTIVAVHRAVYLARTHPESRVLLATFSDPLANALNAKVRRLLGGEPRLGERLEVRAMDAAGERLYESSFGRLKLASREQIQQLLTSAAAAVGSLKFSPRFLLSEWEEMVDAWQLASWEAYRDVRRLGRKTRLPETQRAALWSVFERVRSELEKNGLLTHAAVFNRLAEAMPSRRQPPFDFVVIDESQDISVAQLRFLAALAGDRPNALFFAGDLGQRIFQQSFSWKSLGVEIRGRARTLQVNYRTSHQIRIQADRLLGPDVADVDGNSEERGHTISMFNGPAPVIRVCSDEADERKVVSEWIANRTDGGVAEHEIAVIVRSAAEVPRAQAVLEAAKIPWAVLDERLHVQAGRASICTMHLVKGLEFRRVAVMACDDEIIPLQSRIAAVADDADLEEVYNTERHLLYVACTRARDFLLVSGVAPASEFLSDLIEG